MNRSIWTYLWHCSKFKQDRHVSILKCIAAPSRILRPRAGRHDLSKSYCQVYTAPCLCPCPYELSLMHMDCFSCARTYTTAEVECIQPAQLCPAHLRSATLNWPNVPVSGCQGFLQQLTDASLSRNLCQWLAITLLSLLSSPKLRCCQRKFF